MIKDTSATGGALWLGMFNHFSFRGRIKKFEKENWQTWQLDKLGYASTFPYAFIMLPANSVCALAEVFKFLPENKF